jgi:hypothetical protein
MSKILPLVAGALFAGVVSTPASAIVVFGSSNVIVTPNLRYLNSASSNPSKLYTTNGSVNPAGSALSVFSVTNAVSGFLPLAATLSNFTLDALVPTLSGFTAGSPFSITGVNGSFSFVSTSPVTVNSVTGTNLLTAGFTIATRSGTFGQNSITLSGNNMAGTLVYTSDFLIFPNTYAAAFSLTGNTVNPINRAGTRLGNFRASVNGNFASDPPPNLPQVPEPETWAMLILGFGLVGAVARRRRSIAIA